MRDFPHHKLLTMALVDTLQFAGLVISATGVSPTMTVILLHASTPCIVWGSRYTFPNRAYSTVQMRGVFLISLAILISISRPIIHLYYLKHYGDYADAQSSLLYVIFAALQVMHFFLLFIFPFTYISYSKSSQGFATLYKEKSIIVWSQPMDIHYLSSWLFFYQCIVAIIAAPLIYLFQGTNMQSHNFPLCAPTPAPPITNVVVQIHSYTGVSSGASNFPITTMAVNFHDGWSCVLGHGPPQNTAYDSSGAMCVNSNIWLLIGYVTATLAVIECIDRVLQISNQTLGRAMAFAVLVAFLALGVYDKQGESGSSLFGTNIGYADLVSIAVLLLGMEIYGQDPEPDVEVITNFSPNA